MVICLVRRDGCMTVLSPVEFSHKVVTMVTFWFDRSKKYLIPSPYKSNCSTSLTETSKGEFADRLRNPRQRGQEEERARLNSSDIEGIAPREIHRI
jgi:hypothetical protein